MTEDEITTSSVFVGRGNELNQLECYYSQVEKDKNPLFVFVEGDYGVGKTALVEHFIEKIKRNKERVFIACCKGSMESETSGLTPFQTLFTDLTKQGIQWKLISENLTEFTKKVAPAWLDIVTGGTASAISTTITETSKIIKPKYTQDNVFVQFTNVMNKLTEKHTTILLFEDAHWIDETSLRLLFYIANHIKDRSILFLVTYRPVEALEIGKNANVFREIRANLLRLGAKIIQIQKGISVQDYINEKYPKNNFSKNIIEKLQDFTGGHPLLVNQLFCLYEDTKAISKNETSPGKFIWSIDENQDLLNTVTKTVDAVLGERLRLMGDKLREILIRASVQGDRFTAQVITNLLELNEYELFSDLNILEQTYRLIVEQGSEEVGNTIFDLYNFAHRFFREYVYQNLNTGQKRILHRQVGICLEQIYPNLLPIAGRLAKHFFEGNEKLKSLKYTIMAVDYEQSKFSWIEAEEWCKFGFEIINRMESPDTEIQKHNITLLKKSGLGLYNNGKDDLALERITYAINLFEKYVDMDYIEFAELLARGAELCDNLNLLEQGFEFVEKGKKILNENSKQNTISFLDLETQEANLWTRRGKYNQSIVILKNVIKQIMKMSQDNRSNRVLADAYNNLGIAMSFTSNFEKSIPAYKECIEISLLIGDNWLASTAMINKAEDLMIIEDYSGAENILNEALELTIRTGNKDDEAYENYEKGLLELTRGNVLNAIELITNAIQISQELGTDEPYYYSQLGNAYLEISNISKAIEFAEKGLELANDTLDKIHTNQVLAKIELVGYGWNLAKGRYLKTFELLEGIDENQFDIAELRKELGEELFKLSLFDEAKENLVKAKGIYEGLLLRKEAKKCLEILKRIPGYKEK